jgi:hypothetical protein
MVTNFRSKRRERKGVGVVIAGVLLTTILLTSFLTYFLVILENDRAKKSYEILSSDAAQEKTLEEYSVLQEQVLVGTDMTVHITNDGSLPLVISQVVLYCTAAACPSSEPDIDSTAETLNSKEETDRDVGPITLTSLLTYRVDVISEKGNIVSTAECTVDATLGTCSSTDDDSGVGDIAQGTGSVQLDYKSYAAIFPDFTVRNGVDQTGRYTQSSEVKGYPAQVLYSDIDTILVQRLRNLDDTGLDLRLTKNTALIVSFGGTPGNQPAPEYICATSGDPITMPPTTYTDATGVLLTAVPAPYDQALGWETIYFCLDNSPTGSINDWQPDTRYSFGINPVFMVMRAKYDGSQIDYAQTIPYQAFTFNSGQSLGMVACLYDTAVSTPSGSSSACGAQTAAAGAQPYKYSGATGTKLWVHINSLGSSGTSPYYVELINHDGTSQCLTQVVAGACSTATLNANRNLCKTAVPDAPLSCTPVSIPAGLTPGYYTIKVTDSANVADTVQATVYMTFQVT